MEKIKAFADIHCHPTLHPFAFAEADKNRKNTLWWDNPPLKRQRKSGFPEYFQSSLPALIRGNVKVIVAALYPLEQAWFDPELLGEGVVTDILAKQIVSHLPVRYINKVQSSSFNYFKYLQKEYDFLIGGQKEEHKFNGELWQYILPKHKNELSEALSKENVVVIIPAIEGAHSFVSGNATQIINSPEVHEQTISNIEKVKQWDYPPLYVTLSHHFYNGISGHTRSIPDGASLLLNQQIGLNDPINERGEAIVDCLLAINKYEGNGPRILIDTKHLSVAARQWYYEKISGYNSQKEEKDKIPLIASHMGYGNNKTLLESIEVPDMYSHKYKSSVTFNPWSINLCDDEIENIVDSNGIIGLNMDQRILSGQLVIEAYKNRFTNRDIRNNRIDVVEFWTRQFALNMLSIIEVIQNSNKLPDYKRNNPWKYISIGSDFDGMINPMDSFIVSDEFKNLVKKLLQIIPTMDEYWKINKGWDLEECLNLFAFKNVSDFLVNNYR